MKTAADSIPEDDQGHRLYGLGRQTRDVAKVLQTLAVTYYSCEDETRLTKLVTL